MESKFQYRKLISDIVLHVESFMPDQIKLVRYSFSTKITDCLQSGSVMMAIGPSGVSSIEYPKLIPGAIVVDDLKNLKNEISRIISDPNSLIERARASHMFAEANFEISRVRNRLQNDFIQLIHKQ